jgi:hypothetical protein
MISFFRRLDAVSKQELESSITVHEQPMPIDKVATTLYGLRSKFMHDAKLIFELSGVTTFSARHMEKKITLPLERLERIFERGVLLRFRFTTLDLWKK